MLDLLRPAHCNLAKDMFFLHKCMGEELNIEQGKIALGLTGVLGTKANQCKIALNIGFKIVALYDFIL